jgi:hypothetical protein
MNADPKLIEVLKDNVFPLLELAKLTDAIVEEFAALDLDPKQKLARGMYFIEALQAIQKLSSSWTKIVETRNGPNFVN